MNHPLGSDFPEAYRIANDLITAESDRGAVLFAASLLESNLGTLIQNRLLVTEDRDDKLFSGAMGPLSTFSAKIEMAYRLGLITCDTKSMLNMFRGVRNDFAHSFEFTSFEDQSIRDRLQNTFEAQAHIYDALISDARKHSESVIEELNDGESNVEFTMEEDWPLRVTFNLFFASTAAALSSLAPDVIRISPQVMERG